MARDSSIGTVSWSQEDVEAALPEFLKVYDQRPIAENQGGMGLCHSYYTWFLLRQLKPRYVIESGVWHGHSTWLIEQACPKSIIVSLDPIPEKRLLYRSISPNVHYYLEKRFVDFASMPWTSLIPNTTDRRERTICFFDDHYGKDRVYQSQIHNFRHLVFDDNYEKFGGNGFNPKGDDFAPKAALEVGDEETDRQLRKVLDAYYEFAPLAKNLTNPDRVPWEKIKDITKKPFDLEKLSLTKEQIDLIERDAYRYTWMAYLRIE